MSGDKISSRLEKIRKFYQKNNRMPSYSEVASLFGFRSKNAAYKLIGRLKEMGLVYSDETGRLLPGALKNSIKLLGSVTAGFPSPAEEELQDTMSLDEYLINNPNSTYLLKVEGDSMVEAGICPGDLVLVDKGITPKSGDIVIAQVDNEWTLKYFEKKGRAVYLRAANKKYPLIRPREELIIGGVVVANVRKYK
jgi:repressor LexA